MPEFTRGQPRRKAVRAPHFAARWKRRHEWCQVCGRVPDVMTFHHIIGGRGGRSDEPCNGIACCWEPCHMAFEGYRMEVNGQKVPLLNIGIALTIKYRDREMTLADLDRLQELHGKRLPEPIPIPAYFVDLWKRNRPEGK